MGVLTGIVKRRGTDHRFSWSVTPARWLWPVLRAVENARDFNRLSCDREDNNVRQRRKHEFPPSLHAATGSAKMRIVLQSGAAIIDGACDSGGGAGVVALDTLANALQILRRGQRPTDFHQGCSKR